MIISLFPPFLKWLMILSIKFAVFLSANTLPLIPAIAGWWYWHSDKILCLRRLEILKCTSPFNDEGIDKKKKTFLKSQNVFLNSEMCCDNSDLFMILNLFLKMFLCGIFHIWMWMHAIVPTGNFYFFFF